MSAYCHRHLQDNAEAVDAAGCFACRLVDECKYLSSLIEKLDKAMASKERIERDMTMVGGFVSGLDIYETAEEIIDRAIDRIKERS